MGKFKMPNNKELLKKKRLCWRKKDPVWVYLEAEMRANTDKKPYNEKVGTWLRFLKDLRYYFRCQGKRKLRRLTREAGPPWYYELSAYQRSILSNLQSYIHQDLLEDLPNRIRAALFDLGISLKLPSEVLLKTMSSSVEDPGLFIWNLYKAIYNQEPCYLKPKYDINGMILMSSLVFIDLEECIYHLDNHAKKIKKPPPPPKKPPPKYFEPKCRYGEYLSRMSVPCYSSQPKKIKKKELPDLDCKIKLRSAESYEKLIQDKSFLQKRAERNIRRKQTEDKKECHYRFWEPPSTLRNTDPKMNAYVIKLKMFREKARTRFMKVKPPQDNIQMHIGTVSYVGEHPRYLLNSVVILPTGYIPLNLGQVLVRGEYVTHIGGYWKYPTDSIDHCRSSCNCVTKWDPEIINYLKDSKCRCHHLYDLGYEGKSKEKYFYPANRHGPFYLDQAKIFQMNPTEEFIRDTFEEALKSKTTTPIPTPPLISPLCLDEKELLEAFLADLSDTPLVIPHLPKANLLNNLQDWVRGRVKGQLTPKKHKKLMLQSQRRWLDLDHMDFRARAYFIPFTSKQLDNMNFNHRRMVQTLCEKMRDDFVKRNRKKQVNQTRLMWSTMKFDTYPSKSFLDVYFTYMPGRMRDTYVINPYSSMLTPKNVGKTCQLKF